MRAGFGGAGFRCWREGTLGWRAGVVVVYFVYFVRRRFLFIWVLSFRFVCVRIRRCIVLFGLRVSARSIRFVACVTIGSVVCRFRRRSVRCVFSFAIRVFVCIACVCGYFGVLRGGVELFFILVFGVLNYLFVLGFSGRIYFFLVFNFVFFSFIYIVVVCF